MSQNELQRVVAELDELISRDEEQQDYCCETGPNEAMRRVVALTEIRNIVALSVAAASRIEAAQAVAPREWDEAMAAARAAVYGSDGRGMIGADRRHLVERVARAIQDVGDSDGLYLKCYGSLAKAVASAGFCINCKDGDIYLTPRAAAPASEAKGPCCEYAGTFLCHCGKFTLIEKPPTVESIAEMKHLLCWAYDNLNDMPVSEGWAAKWCKKFNETEFAKNLLSKPAASSAAGACNRNCDCVGECKAGNDSKPVDAFAERMRADILADTTINAEQEQTGEPELPQPVSSVALAAWGPKPDYYTADQMHEYARAALLRRAARVEVTDAMVERALKGWAAHQNKCRITTMEGCLRAALSAVLESAK